VKKNVKVYPIENGSFDVEVQPYRPLSLLLE
jgi:hypothetical protein